MSSKLKDYSLIKASFFPETCGKNIEFFDVLSDILLHLDHRFRFFRVGFNEVSALVAGYNF